MTLTRCEADVRLRSSSSDEEISPGYLCVCACACVCVYVCVCMRVCV